MRITKEVAPPHSVILISEPGKGDVPPSLSGSLIAATDSCIAVGCRAEVDGPTEFVLGAIEDVDNGEPPTFSGALETPHGIVSLQNVYNESIAEMAVASTQTAVSIWLNDPNGPDKVVVGLDASES